MTNQEIYELMTKFEKSSLHTMKLSSGDFSLELEKGQGFPPLSVPSGACLSAETSGQTVQKEEPAITAPLVGTFYASPSPEAEPFVSVGSTVKKGQTVCLIEAMKMMSEVPAPCDCVILEIVKKDGTLAGFGEILLRYRPC